MNQPPPTFLYALAGQSLTFDAPEGVPSSVTSVTIHEDIAADTGTGQSATTGSASVESASTTLSASAGAGQANQSLLTVAATTSFAVKRRYLLTSAYGWREFVEVTGVDATNKQLYLRTALQSDYLSGDTIASPRMLITLDTTWVSDSTKLSGSDTWVQFPWMTQLQREWYSQLAPRPRWRAEWVYVVNSQTYRHASFFDLVRYPLEHGVTAQDVDRLSRGWLFRLAAEDQGEADGVIAEALQQVKLDLWEHDIAAYALRSNETIHELVKLKAIVIVEQQALLHGSNQGSTDAALVLATQNYAGRIDGLLGVKARGQIQISQDGTGGLPFPSPLFSVR